MKVAEWRASLSAYAQVTHLSPDTEALLRDFEAAEAINVIREDTIRSLQRAVRDAEARAAAFLEDAHRLSERCVAAEEERNAAQRELAVVDGLLARRFALDDCPQRYDKIAKAIDYAKRAEAAEARAQAAASRAATLEARLLELESLIGNTAALSPQEPQEKGESRE